MYGRMTPQEQQRLPLPVRQPRLIFADGKQYSSLSGLVVKMFLDLAVPLAGCLPSMLR